MAVPGTESDHLENLEAQLHAPGVIDERWYRRNMSAYELVCYLSVLIALRHSNNLEPAPMFIKRADEFLRGPHASAVTPAYGILANRYLRSMASLIRQSAGVSETSKSLLSENLNSSDA